MRRTKTDYIFERPQSRNLFVRLRGADGKRYVKSLGTSDYRQAEIIAGKLITEHKRRLFEGRPHVVSEWRREYEPGLHTGLEGEKIYATETELHYLDETPVRREPNGFISQRLLARGPLSADQEFGLFDKAEAPPRPVSVKDGDDKIMNTYFTARNITARKRSEAEDVLLRYKTLIGKPFKDATRDDGRKLAEYFKETGNKSATVAKKVGYLRAAVEIAIDEGKLTFNPFRNVVPEGKDELKRKPLSDADMELCKNNLSKLSDTDQLLFRFLATTGARLGEAFQIDGEEMEHGIRFVMVGSKTEASRRRLPLPADFLSHQKKEIVGPLFALKGSAELTAKAASRRLNAFLDECGLINSNIVIHSLRHRAADRLRSYECPQDIRRAILGHEDASVSEGYGEGFSVSKLKEWIDKIGFGT
jgi:integrase